MDLTQVIKQRRSVRAYEHQALTEQQINLIMEAGQRAATSRGKEARRFVLVTDLMLKQRMQQEAKMQEFVADAAMLVVGVATVKESTGSVYDVVISLAQMEMMAVSLGLGTCWLGVYDKAVVEELLGVPEDAKIASILAIGCPAGEGEQRAKQPLEQLFSCNKYQG